MTPSHALRLLLLSALWGASFLFMRVSVPALGPVLLILARVLLAALFLLGVAMVLHQALPWRKHWRHFLVLGGLNSALPFVLFAFAAQTVSASLLSILNATAPTWAALIAALVSRQMPKAKVMAGMALGWAGVALLAGVESLHLPPGGVWAVLAGLTAALCYGAASVYTQKAPQLDALSHAHGSMWGAALLLAPWGLAASPWPPLPSTTVLLAVLALGVGCSGVAYLMYFRLVRELGPASALTVTFLIPLFGLLWGHLLLNEALGWHMALGGLCVLVGTAWVTGFSLPKFSRQGEARGA